MNSVLLNVPVTPEVLSPYRPQIEQAYALIPALTHWAEASDANGTVPQRQFQALFDAGLLKLTVARSHGGDGAGLAAAQAVVCAIAQGDPNVALILAMHYGLHAAIARSLSASNGVWPAAIAEELIEACLSGVALLNSAQVEPELGSPSHGGLPATIASKHENGWHLTGHKLYVTGSHLLNWVNVLAVTDEPEPQLGSFLVPMDAAGVQIVPTWHAVGMRATASHDLLLQEVFIPSNHAIGLRPASNGLVRDVHSNAWYFSLVATVYDGIARAARDWLLQFLHARKPSALDGQSLATVPNVQSSVGEIEVLLQSSACLLQSHAHAYDAGHGTEQLAAAAKHLAIDNAVRIVQLAVELSGNHGLTRRNPLERHLRNVLCSRSHAPSNALIRGNLGKAALQKASAAGIAPHTA